MKKCLAPLLLTSVITCSVHAEMDFFGTILRDRATFPSLALESDDALEIVHFVGGG